MFKSTELFEHMQRYTREVFADRLRKEGFSSYKGQDVHWYRIVNNEVIQAVYFVAFNCTPCTFAEIKYGCHPLFVPPIFQKSPIINDLWDHVQISEFIPEVVPGSTTYGVDRLLLYSEYNNRPYRVPDALILCSPDQNNGSEVLEKLLAVLNRTTTAFACYELHKELYRQLSQINSIPFKIRSSYFIDEALYFEDKELFSCCREFARSEARQLENAIEQGFRVPKMYRQSWERGSILNQVFECGNFEEYLQILQDRAHQNLRLLERNTGIRTDL